MMKIDYDKLMREHFDEVLEERYNKYHTINNQCSVDSLSFEDWVKEAGYAIYEGSEKS